MIAFGPIVILLLCGLAAWMGVAAVLRVCRVPRGVEPGGSCGLCGYAYTGWQRCPECGGDIAEEGIATPRLMLKHRGSLRAALFSLTMLAGALVFLLTGITLGICQAAGWMQWTRQTEYSLNTQAQAPHSILAHWQMLGRSGSGRASGQIVIAVKPGGPFFGTFDTRPNTVGVAHAEIDAATGAFVIVDPNGRIERRGDRFEPADGVRLLQLAGAPVEPAVLDAAGLQLAEIAEGDNAMAAAALRPAVAFSGSTVLTEGSSTTSAVPSLPFAVFGAKSSTGAMLLAAIVSAVLYIFTLVLVVKRRRRLMRRVHRPAGLSSLSGV